MRRSFVVVLFSLAAPLLAQNVQQPQRINTPPPPLEEFTTNRPSTAPTSLSGEEYRVGRDDLIDVSVFDAPDLSSSGRVSASGFLSLPLIGVVSAAGKTTHEMERVIEDVLKKKFMHDPHVAVFIREYASQPVSIGGAVRRPGTYQIKGQKYLLDMLNQAEGLDLNAGKTIQVIRRNADSADSVRAITIDADDLYQNGRTELNIPIKAGDTITVLRAASIFVVGEVMNPGEIPLTQGKNFTVGMAVAVGKGFTREANRGNSKIIRIHADLTKEEIPVNIGKIYSGALSDVPLLPNDILFVPANKMKTGLTRTLDTTIAVVSGRLIWRF